MAVSRHDLSNNGSNLGWNTQMKAARTASSIAVFALLAAAAAAKQLHPAVTQSGPSAASATDTVAPRRPPATPVSLRLTVLEHYPHDPRAFTQGLLLRGSTLYESTGLYGQSSLREVDLVSGVVRRKVSLPAHLFGEGLAMVEDRLVQLTWTNGIARVYSLPHFTLLAEHRYEGEGWGLCYDGESLIMSDGTDRLFVRDPDTFAVRRTLRAFDENGPVNRLNELECVGNHVYANVWQSWTIVRIDTRSGHVDARIDASNLLSAMEKATLPAEAVMNGIAYDPASDTFLLTGKLWPRIHRVRLLGAEIE